MNYLLNNLCSIKFVVYEIRLYPFSNRVSMLK